MLQVQPSFTIEDSNSVMRMIEKGARVCYKSEGNMCEGSDIAIIGKILTPKHGVKHESVLEHGVITAKFVNDRGVSHEEVRHRHAAFSQESTRYCNYAKDKYDNEIAVVTPFFFAPAEPRVFVAVPRVECSRSGTSLELGDTTGFHLNALDVWLLACLWSEWSYMTLITVMGKSAQEARSVLPNSLKTEIQITANVREWRHILNLRTNRDAHPQIRQVMVPFGWELAKRWPTLFGEFASTEHPAPAAMVEAS